ncbi:MAG: glycine/betaine ABC transporter substrate-binding protein [Actinomycetota bacterium]|nr:glycine/betaine ABC transporter substrate-binding protein [Actinomycetota bacterium]MDQ5819310.1 glycine/betaine ABC transporter substrate-binding protein [Actinomycetota bacterium]
MKNRTELIRAIPALLAALALIALAACGNVGDGGGSEGGGGGPKITVGSKNFTEQYILGELYAQALAANGFNVEKKLDLGSAAIADKALQNGQIDLYPEYTGTSLVEIFKQEEQPVTPEATYQRAKELYADRDPADTMLTPTQFNNTYGIFVRKEVAEERNLQTLADLAEVSPELTFVSFSEFQNRSDGYPNMQKNYPGLEFGDVKIVNSIGGPIYEGVLQGEGDVGVGFTTDGQLASEELAVMEDPKSIWPFYYPAPVVRSDVLEKNPKMKEVLNEVSASLDAETMRELNAQVDIEQEEPEDVAKEYLEDEGLVE